MLMMSTSDNIREKRADLQAKSYENIRAGAISSEGHPPGGLFSLESHFLQHPSLGYLRASPGTSKYLII